jgi:hypothetical protein
MTSGARGWILWVSLAIMCADSLVSLLPVAAEYFIYLLPTRISYAMYGHRDTDSDKEDFECETEDRLVPIRWVLAGLGGSVVIGIILVWAVFGNEGIKPWATLIGFVMGSLLSILG